MTNDLTALTSLVDGYFIGLEDRLDTEIDVLGLGVDILANKANQTAETYGYTVLETLPVMLSPLALAAINDETLAIPVAVKLLIDLVGEFAAAILIAREAEGR